MTNRHDTLQHLQSYFEGWDVELIQLARQQLPAGASLALLPSIRIVWLRAGRSFVIRGALPKIGDCILFSSPDSIPVRSLGVPIDPSRFMIAGNGAPIDVFVPDGNAILCVTTAGLIPGVAARGAKICSTRCDYVSKLVNSMEAVMDSVTATHQPPAQALQETLIREASDAIQASSIFPVQAGTQSLRAAAVARACRLIDAKLTKAITLTHLSQHCGVGVRTLEYGFRQFYDITPVGFIKSQRLTRTHTALSRVPTQVSSINEVARGLGFTHMGQYAKDYRELFGESPSMTLQRALRQTNAQPSHESADQEGLG